MFKRKKKKNKSNAIEDAKNEKIEEIPNPRYVIVDRDKYLKRLMKGESELSARADTIKPYESSHTKNEKVKIKFYKDRVRKKDLIRKTDRFCPKCSTMLYNVALDGIHFYCPKCKGHYEII